MGEVGKTVHGRTKYGAAAHTIVQRWTDCQLETQERVAEKSFGGGNQRLGVGGCSQCIDTCDSAVRSRSSAAASRNLRSSVVISRPYCCRSLGSSIDLTETTRAVRRLE